MQTEEFFSRLETFIEGLLPESNYVTHPFPRREARTVYNPSLGVFGFDKHESHPTLVAILH